MKKKQYLLLLSIICISFLLVGCGKDGATGPQGSTGVNGAAGVQGPVGPAGPKGTDGSDGSIIYSGKGEPATATGKAGDLYLNTSNGLLYGPKTTAGWGTGLSLKGSTGATGTPGAAGSTTLSGAGLPGGSLGKTGDYYLDKINYLLYGPKTGSDWGVPVNLRGPAGPQGPAGNANVKVDVFTVTTSEWNYKSAYQFDIDGSGTALSYISRYFDRANSLITADLLNSGLILVYFQPSPSTNPVQWQPLPFSYTYLNANFNYNYAYENFVGKVRLHFFFTKIGTASLNPPDVFGYDIPTHKFKIIVISGELISSIRENHINVNSYNEISRFLAIQ